MKQTAKLALIASALALISGGAFAQAKDIPIGKSAPSYVQSPNGTVVVDPFGLCWRTPWWNAASAGEGGPTGAGCQCDKASLPKAVCEPPPPPPAPPKPVAPPPPPAPTVERVTLAADALFDFDKADIKSDAKAKLDDLVSKLAGVTLEVMIAVGHTDTVGADAYNEKLSVRRAEAVKKYLVSKGVEPNRVYTEGKGERQPVADNRTAEGRAKNRRVEIEVVGTRARR
jgi:OOP family OmpA-OmpF porin